MNFFYTDLRYYPAFLDDPRGIVMSSFFSQKTISHLDLEICHSARYRPLNRVTDFMLEKSYFCSEESLKNSLLPKRRLLYTLNLDLPGAREYSNSRNGSAPKDLSLGSKSLFVAVFDSVWFFKEALIKLIESAIDQTDREFDFLKWMADFRPLESIVLPGNIQFSCAKILQRECVDSEFAVKCFEKHISLMAFLRTRDVKVLESLLYNSKLCDFDVTIRKSHCFSLTDYFIFYMSFRSVHSILMYDHTAYYNEKSYERYKKSIILDIRRDSWEKDLSRPEEKMNKSRLFRLQQIIYIFQNLDYRHPGQFDNPDASEALRLVWSSIPDCFISLQEMIDTYGHVFHAGKMRRIHRFYEAAIRQTVSRREPRSLSQYCRTVVRKSLHSSKQWLPDGIQQLNLPPRFRTFLNLERDSTKLSK